MKESKMQQIFNEIFKPVSPNLAKIFWSFTELNKNFQNLQNLMKFQETQQKLMMLNNNFVHFYQI